MKYLFALFLTFSLFSCNEQFKNVETEEFNKEIAPYKEIETPEQLILFYYNYPKNEGKPNLKITKQKLENQVYEITLIHDFQQDDCQKAEKIIMTAKKVGRKWKVEKILKNWKCYDGRGHTDWGIGNCG